ncbi:MULTISPECIES: DUF2892 domain-containing protein [Laceyella]|jgi:hypothetical protein|uniref:DUF2892 domain-containing protein n=1 Tax=Laceyella sacchari TaxID=37482 RepID=A0ABY5U2V2_LACSH|nr:DUF2892 domain-containing protein [Laceyella sacchari]KPC77136.1 hypothetical protein ADL26_03335 [Thermoactinomyces vulgaris]MRG28466.1 DUF2892 domain-containing protein [Laceyella tengchongensis]TCW36155.1 DUF2892 family protein [Laceyella sacchari]UWE03971.1 DUF2892 domain-containing protein [Laceyella sacchari]
MKQNVGTVDAIIRITCGLLGLTWCVVKGRRNFPYMIALMSALKVAEGITRYCPMLDMLNKRTT